MFPGFIPPGFAEDLQARGLRRMPWAAAYRRPLVAFMYRLRCAEHFRTQSGPVSRLLASWCTFRARRLGMMLGLTVPPGTCAPDLHIMHWGALVINGHARIGRNCSIHMGVNIGAGKGGVPRIGDNVYIGPGAKIFGGITIGDNVRIGANAVVNRDVPPNVIVAGVPARVIRHVDPSGPTSETDEALI